MRTNDLKQECSIVRHRIKFRRFELMHFVNSESGMTRLNSGLVQVGADGSLLSEEQVEDLFVEDPTEMLGKRMDFRITIEDLKGVPRDETDDVYVKFTFMDGELIETPRVSAKTVIPFKFNEHITIEHVLPDHLVYFENESLRLSVMAKRIPKDASSSSAGKSTAELVNQFRSGAAADATPGTRRHSVLKGVPPASHQTLSVVNTVVESPADSALAKEKQNTASALRRVDRMTAKIKRVEELIRRTKKAGKAEVDLKELESAMHPSQNRRFKAAVKVLMLSSRIKKLTAAGREANKDGKNSKTDGKSSKACTIQ